MKKGYLPLGTFVRLRELKTQFVIMGYQHSNAKGEVKDYAAVRAPLGLLNMKDTYLFDHDVIEEIVHMGNTDKQYEMFIALVEQKEKELAEKK